MIMRMTVRHARQDTEEQLLEAIQKNCAQVKGHPGVLGAHTLKDEDTGALIELVVWSSKEAYMVALPTLINVTSFSDLEEGEPTVYHMEEV
jgi:heme-degrading monooxygenase HmoA